MKHMIKRVLEKLKHSQVGSATIEAVISFTGFLFVIFTILNIVNLCRAQMLVSNAMDTVTKELTQYSYFYQISGLRKFDQEIQAIGDENSISLNNLASSVGDLYNALGTAASSSEEEIRGLNNSLQEGSLTSDGVQVVLLNLDTHATNVSASIERVEAQIGDVIDNPVTYLKSIIAVAGSQGLDTFKSHVIAAPLAKSLMVKHFGDNKVEANAILEQLGVVGGLDGMNFTRSTIFQEDHPDEIHLAVYYKVKVVQLFKWADFEATICKETRARAWLGGDDVKHLEQKTVIASGSSSGGETGGNGEASSTEGDDEEGSEDDEDSDSHVGDTGLEKYLAGVESEIIQEINQRYDTTDWTEAQWREAVSGIVLPIVSIKPTATPEPTEAPQPTETPAPTEAPQPTATPTPTITPEPTAAPTSSITFSSWEEMKEAHPRQVWAYIRENKPSYSPDIQKWFKNGGTITIEENEKGDKIWTYTSSSGDSVPYINGYVRFPDQYLHPDIKSIDIGEFNDRDADRRAVIKWLQKNHPNDYEEILRQYEIHHDIENGIIRLVRAEIHDEFSHVGGNSIYNKNEGE